MRILRRYRALSITFLVTAIFVTAAAFVLLPWTFESVAELSLVPSKIAAEKIGSGNPYLAYSGSINELGDVVAYQVEGAQQAAKLKSGGYTSSYVISDAVGTQAPILVIDVTGKNTANVQGTLNAVIKQIETQLAVTQSGTPSASLVKDQVLSYAPSASRLTSKKFRPLAEIFVLCVILFSVILILFDALRSRRKSSMTAADAFPRGHQEAPHDRSGNLPVQLGTEGLQADRPVWSGQGSSHAWTNPVEPQFQPYPARPDMPEQGNNLR